VNYSFKSLQFNDSANVAKLISHEKTSNAALQNTTLSFSSSIQFSFFFLFW